MRPLATGFLLACTTGIAPVDAMPTDPPAAEEQQYRAAEPYPGNDSGTIRCESPRGRERTCEADTRGGARLTKQLSRSPCVEGKSWGVRPNGIWVNAGCRADFALGEGGPAPTGPIMVRCESNGGGRRHCPASTMAGVQLVRQLSRSPCIRHSTWSFDRNSIWVAQGCRADFQVGVGAPTEALGPQKLRCESDRGRERRCDVGVWKGAQLTRQLSKTPCVQGQSWGWDVRGVWVSRGCRAEFTVW
ncbi:hypothetical protein LYSHEL_30530 [Lysobacter helvus]|uniref:DUF3011 domain-containing protein n=2 Tax=Lysobacteraceae TaxID=32033 RepID=A0ABN6FZW0_9GAMM|nr:MULTISPECIES: DUF3011 domain-containing protein [Lysobacter]BCT94026.1 hypothetical protein LYSCAS_30500 [Lysobacter caseinilyticus]BCT97182.1 hypothetical protein LYSHEL_30530 [Lysobacter helvus]